MSNLTPPLLSFLFVLLLLLLSLFTPQSNAQTTTPHIEPIFMGKCFDKNPVNTNCTQVWEAFSHAAMMDMFKVSDTDFAPFYAMADFTTPRDNALFWSGNKNFANTLAADGTRFTTLEETSTGYILNGLSWCGSLYEEGVAPSFDYVNSCSYVQNSSYYGSQGVWNKCSQYFAANVMGNITIMLQPQPISSGEYMAYRNTSIFYLIELPNINADWITQVRILVLANKTRAPNEVCGSGSLLRLRNDLVAKFGFEPICVDDPEHIIDILCADGQENTPECLAAYMHGRDEPKPNDQTERAYLVWAIAGSCVSAVLLIAVVVLAYNLVAMRKRGQYSMISQRDLRNPLLASY